MAQNKDDLALLLQILESYDLKKVVEYLNRGRAGTWSKESLKLLMCGKTDQGFSDEDMRVLRGMVPAAPAKRRTEFDFIDLFAGIGGIRKGFEAIGGRCVYTSEWNPYAVKTYKANYYSDPLSHKFNTDIRIDTRSNRPEISDEEAYRLIDRDIPDHQVLLAGFPCQPFSIAGVSKKNSLGRKHGFEDETQGTLFFDVARIIRAKQPAAFVLENVKNLKSHDKGNTFRIIMKALDELGYEVADAAHLGQNDPKVIDAIHFGPQHRERIVLVGFRRDLGVHDGFTLKDIERKPRPGKPMLGEILDPDDETYILTPKLWEYLFNYSIKHKAKGNGFGYGLVKGDQTTRTLSARYYKDGSEILVDRGYDHDLDINHEYNQAHRPRRLTPRECARLMGYDRPGQTTFRIPVSDTQAYKQFGNSVVVDVFEAVALLMRERIIKARKIEEKRRKLEA